MDVYGQLLADGVGAGRLQAAEQMPAVAADAVRERLVEHELVGAPLAVERERAGLGRTTVDHRDRLPGPVAAEEAVSVTDVDADLRSVEVPARRGIARRRALRRRPPRRRRARRTRRPAAGLASSSSTSTERRSASTSVTL